MIVIRPVGGVGPINARLNRLKAALQPPALTQVLELEAQKTFAEIVMATPKKWTGQTRRSWRVLRPSGTLRVVANDNKVMRFLESGTANGGTGYIYPTTSKALFIPLVRRAMYGFKKGFKFGVDFVLARRVRGIAPRRIAEKQALRSRERLKLAIKEHVRKALA